MAATSDTFALTSAPTRCEACGGRGGEDVPVQWSDGGGWGHSPCAKCKDGENFEVAILPAGCKMPEGLATLTPTEFAHIRWNVKQGNTFHSFNDAWAERFGALGLHHVAESGPGFAKPAAKVGEKGLALLAKTPRFWARRDMKRHEWKIMDTGAGSGVVCGSRRSAQMILDSLHATQG